MSTFISVRDTSSSTKNEKLKIVNKITRKSKKSRKSQINNKNSIILPSPEEFRESTYFEDMIQEYKDKNISPNKITDKEILEYINNMNNTSKKWLAKEIKEIKEYKNLPNKIDFQPITIPLLRKKYWNAKTKTWKPIKYYYANGDNPNDSRFGPVMVNNVKDRNKIEKVFCNEFIPNGNLDETHFDLSKKREVKTHKKWLQGKQLGPYKYKNYDYKNEKKLFYLDGKTKFCGDNKYNEGYGLQVCNDNYVSGNCIDGPSWISFTKT
jgi:hypothetical protein